MFINTLLFADLNTLHYLCVVQKNVGITMKIFVAFSPVHYP